MLAYVDSSVIVAAMFAEPDAARYQKHLHQYDQWVSSMLLEAEVCSAAKRAKVALQDARENIRRLTLVTPDRSLFGELEELFSYGYCRGADAFHIATALYLDPQRNELTFVTADVTQARLASKCGFTVFR